MIRWLSDFHRWRRDVQVKNLEAVIDERDRLIAVLRAENDQLAEVIARDRARIAAEMAAYNRERAFSEGVTDERDRTGLGRRSA